MTPERQKWWDSLPEEEKLVREGTGMRDEDRYCASCGQKLRWEE